MSKIKAHCIGQFEKENKQLKQQHKQQKQIADPHNFPAYTNPKGIELHVGACFWHGICINCFQQAQSSAFSSYNNDLLKYL